MWFRSSQKPLRRAFIMFKKTFMIAAAIFLAFGFGNFAMADVGGNEPFYGTYHPFANMKVSFQFTRMIEQEAEQVANFNFWFAKHGIDLHFESLDDLEVYIRTHPEDFSVVKCSTAFGGNQFRTMSYFSGGRRDDLMQRGCYDDTVVNGVSIGTEPVLRYKGVPMYSLVCGNTLWGIVRKKPQVVSTASESKASPVPATEHKVRRKHVQQCDCYVSVAHLEGGKLTGYTGKEKVCLSQLYPGLSK